MRPCFNSASRKYASRPAEAFVEKPAGSQKPSGGIAPSVAASPALAFKAATFASCMVLLFSCAIAATNLGVGLGPPISQRLFASITENASSFMSLGPGSEDRVGPLNPGLIEFGRDTEAIEKRLADVSALVLVGVG